MDKIVHEVNVAIQKVVPGVNFGPETRLSDELGFSSLSLISVLTKLCDLFGIDMLGLTDADLARLDRVDDLIALFSRTASVPSA